MTLIQYPLVYAGIFLLLISAVLSVVNRDASIPSFLFNSFFWPCLYAAGLLSAWRNRQKQSETLKVVMYIGIAAAVIVFILVAAVATIEKGFLLMLICMQAARNFTLTNRRELYFACLISLILILYAASASKETSFLLYILVYVLSGIFTFMADHIDERLNYAKGGDKDILIRKMNLPAKGFGLAIAVITLSLGIYLIIPRMPSPHIQAFPSGGWNYKNEGWDREALTGEQQKEQMNAKSGLRSRVPDTSMSNADDSSKTDVNTDYKGFQDRFDVTKVGEATRSNEIVFYLQTDRPIYSRGKVFDVFDGRFWSYSGTGDRKIYSDKRKFVFDDSFYDRGLIQIYAMNTDMTQHIFAAYKPAVLIFPGNVIEKGSSLALRAPEYLRKGTVYSVISGNREIEGRSAGDTEYPTDEYDRYLQLPSGLSPKVRDLGNSITEQFQNDYEKAKAIESHLKNNYEYTLNTLLMEWENNPAEEFLFNLKKGHCELFASSMVLLLRTSGIPSRLVTGYHANRYNPVTGYFEIRKMDAHAWVEAYIKEHGWVTFEPTPTFVQPLSGKKRRFFMASNLNQYLRDRLKLTLQANPEKWWSKLLQYLLDIGNKVIAFLLILQLQFCMVTRIIFFWFKTTGWKFFAGAGFFAAGVFLLYRLLYPTYRRSKLRKLRETDYKQFLYSCYRETERIFTEKGFPRPTHYTAMEYCDILKPKFQTLHTQIYIITLAFQKARYSPLPVGSEDAERAYEAYLSILKSFAS
ncbi:MAG: DUF3488 domain-containing protein [Nitrospirae bacterium]|nr:DUF3488 domain-containing protein [Nitrospirota bacterium]